MVRLCVLIVLSLFIAIPAFAQEGQDIPPNYRVQIFDYELSADETEIIINYGVYNQGGAANEPTLVALIDLSTGRVIATDQIRALSANGDNISDASIAFPITFYDPGSNPQVQVSILPDDEEAFTMQDNEPSIGVGVPLYDPSQIGNDATEVDSDSDVFIIPLLDVEFDPNNRDQLTILAGFLAIGAILLWLFILILRLMFRRPPTFGNWQPPYANMPPQDPNSTYGRRQMWQPHAQNNVVPSPCKMGTIYARKVLLGMDGDYLSSWSIAALRMTQYDMYGRVSRSQTLASKRLVKRLDKISRKNDRWDTAKLSKKTRPVARSLAKQFTKKINKRSAMLPIAMDVRLQGKHGEVRILFELYECQNGQPSKLDFWEPEMTVMGKTIHENYTYTLYGQSGGETFREYRKRLPDDIMHALVDMLRTPAPTTPRAAAPDADPLASTQPVQTVNGSDDDTQA
jgi:hypothetical protein